MEELSKLIKDIKTLFYSLENVNNKLEETQELYDRSIDNDYLTADEHLSWIKRYKEMKQEIENNIAEVGVEIEKREPALLEIRDGLLENLEKVNDKIKEAQDSYDKGIDNDLNVDENLSWLNRFKEIKKSLEKDLAEVEAKIAEIEEIKRKASEYDVSKENANNPDAPEQTGHGPVNG